jgi:hypothetical protein
MDIIGALMLCKSLTLLCFPQPLVILLIFKYLDKDNSNATVRFPGSAILLFLSIKKTLRNMNKEINKIFLETKFFRNIINVCHFAGYIKKYVKETFFLMITLYTSLPCAIHKDKGR